MDTTPEPIVRRKLSDEVFDRLKGMIVSGELAPGDAMPAERDLMARFGVGRPAIREAMQALAGMGLIAISHGERARVLAMTPQSVVRQVDRAAEIMLSTSPAALDHLKEARILFERGVVVVTTSNRPPDDLYKGGLHRDRFLPFIELLKERLDVADLGDGNDRIGVARSVTLRGRLRGVEAEVTEHDSRAGVDERAGDLETDALGAAGHDGGTTLQQRGGGRVR